MDTWLTVLLTILGVAAACAATFYGTRRLFARRSFEHRIITHHITERVQAVGRLIGLEVCAKEIATATSGWAWLPPLLLTQARIAMIFHFRKQYIVDLSRIRPDDVTDIGQGRFGSCVRIRLPEVEGSLHLTDVSPYDIQSGRVMGLLDVIPMNAQRQRELMKRAQEEAARLFEESDRQYREQARTSIERHVRSLLGMCGVEAEIEWRPAASLPDQPAVAVELSGPASVPAQPVFRLREAMARLAQAS